MNTNNKRQYGAEGAQHTATNNKGSYGWRVKVINATDRHSTPKKEVLMPYFTLWFLIFLLLTS